MEWRTEMTKPLLLAITGRPGVGKTTIAQALALQLGWPVVQRDACMAGYVYRRPGTRLPHQHVNAAFFSIMTTLLQYQVSCIVEAAFQHPRWEAPLTTASLHADVIVVRCHIPYAIALARMQTRLLRDPLRQVVHRDEDYIMQQQATIALEWVPVDLAFPTVDVDALQSVETNVATILAFVALHS